MRIFKIIHASPKDGYKPSSVKSDMQKFVLVAIIKKWKKSFSLSDGEFGSLLINVSLFDIFYLSFFNWIISLPVINLFPSASHFSNWNLLSARAEIVRMNINVCNLLVINFFFTSVALFYIMFLLYDCPLKSIFNYVFSVFF